MPCPMKKMKGYDQRSQGGFDLDWKVRKASEEGILRLTGSYLGKK